MTTVSRRALLTLTAAGATAAVLPARAWAADPVAAADPWWKPMRTAIENVPDGELPTATAAQVRLTTAAGSWTGRSGVADVVTRAPVPAGARFRIGSVTKTFTATVVLQLAAEGRVRLDAPVALYLPGLLPAAYRSMTVRHLLDHRTGLPVPSSPDGVAWQIEHRFDRHRAEDLVRAALEHEREFEPGTRQRYTNMGPIVAGLLIRRVTGRTYGDEIHRRIARPLGLRDTRVPGHDPAIRGPHARGYQELGGRLVDVTRWNQSGTPASGDMISSVRDLDVFTRALFGGRLLPAAQQRELFALPAEVRGAKYSAGLQSLGGGLWGKSGSRYGYSAALAATADGGSRLIYSVNATDAKSTDETPVVGRIIGTALALITGG